MRGEDVDTRRHMGQLETGREGGREGAEKILIGLRKKAERLWVSCVMELCCYLKYGIPYEALD